MSMGSVSPQAKSTGDRKKKIALGVGGIVLLVLLCCCVVAAVVIFLDPFRLHLLDRLTGRYDAAATAMPADTEAYVGVNIVNLANPKTSQLIDVFAQATGNENIRDTATLQQELDKTMQEQYGVSVSKDFTPWIGQYVGVGMTGVGFDENGQPLTPEWVVAIESRDNGRADEFLAYLRDQIAKTQDVTFAESEYGGAKIYSSQTEQAPRQIAFTRSGSVVLIGTNTSSIQNSVDAQNNKMTLADNRYFRSLLAELPSGRVATLYFSGAQIESLLGQLVKMPLGANAQSFTNLPFQEMVIAWSIVDAGMQLDAVYAYDPTKLSDYQKEAMKYTGMKPKTDGLFPGSTVLYVSGQHLDLAMKVNQDVLSKLGSAQDFAESMMMLEEQTGIDIQNDLIQYLNGEYAFGVFSSSQGFLAESLKINLGASILFESKASSELRVTLEKLNTAISMSGDIAVGETQAGGISLYELTDPGSDMKVAVYGLTDQYLVLSTGSDSVAEMFGGGSKLSQSSRYQQTVQALPKDMALTMYLDLEGLLGMIKEGLGAMGVRDTTSFDEAIGSLKPIKAIAIAASPVRKDVGRNTVLILVPTGASR